MLSNREKPLFIAQFFSHYCSPSSLSNSALSISLCQAIQNPGDLQLQEKAWNAVCPLVAKLKRFYEFSLRLGKRKTIFPLLYSNVGAMLLKSKLLSQDINTHKVGKVIF